MSTTGISVNNYYNSIAFSGLSQLKISPMKTMPSLAHASAQMSSSLSSSSLKTATSSSGELRSRIPDVANSSSNASTMSSNSANTTTSTIQENMGNELFAKYMTQGSPSSLPIANSNSSVVIDLTKYFS